MASSANERAISQDSGYIPIKLVSLRIDSVTNFDVFFQPRPDQPFVLYAEKNIRFTEAVRQRLIENRISDIYIRSTQREAYGRYVEDNMADIIGDPNIVLEDKADMLYTSACMVMEAVLGNPQAVPEIRRGKEMVRHTVDFMLSERHVFACLLRAVSTTYHVYTHSMNVVAYTIALAQRAGYDNAAILRELAIGALLHDVGKSRIDPAILNSTTALTASQWEIMKQHPQYGFDMLTATGSVGEIALDIVRHHHEKLRGDGYPDGLAGSTISPFVRIVTIADAFDALTTERTFQKARNTFNAFSVMKSQLSADLDPELFRLFVAMMGHPDK